MNRKIKMILYGFLCAFFAMSSINMNVIANENLDTSNTKIGSERTIIDRKKEYSDNQATLKSEKRIKYEELLKGNYKNGELKSKFHEYFGNDMSDEYIRENYCAIFDLEEGEIDEGFLAVITYDGRVDFNVSNNTRIQTYADSKDDGEVDILNQSYIRTPLIPAKPFAYDRDSESSINNAEDITNNLSEFVEQTEVIEQNMANDDASEVNEGDTFNDSLTEKKEEDLTNDAENLSEVLVGDAQTQAALNPNNFTTVTFVSKTYTSVTLDLWFVDNNSPNNALQMWDPYTRTSYFILGQGNGSAPKTSRVTIPNLKQGLGYTFWSGTWNAASSTWINSIGLDVKLDLPPETLNSYSRGDMTFLLDKSLTDTWGTNRTNSFLDKTNQGYSVIHGLVGGDKPYSGDKMELKSTRNLYHPIEGWSGQPIFWQTNTPDVYLLVAIDHAYSMNKFNVNTTETPFHEISHNFDSYKWSFEPEALAIFKIYYYYSITNEGMGVANQDRAWTGKAYKTYMKSYADRYLGEINYDLAMSQNVYSPYSLAYSLANIADNIGWEPFKQTFAYFNNLSYTDTPITCIGKFNLFLSKLKDYSGKDVFSMLTAKEKSVYGAEIGGTIEPPDTYYYLEWGWPQKNIPINEYDYNDEWQPHLNAAVSNWNNSGAGVTFTKTANCENSIIAEFLDYAWYGLCTPLETTNNGALKKFKIQLNSRTISEDAAPGVFGSFVTAIFAHEMGHCLWLADNPTTNKPSIMIYKDTSMWHTITKPTVYDINAVKAKYK